MQQWNRRHLFEMLHNRVIDDFYQFHYWYRIHKNASRSLVLARLVTAAIFVMEIEEVLVDKMASGRCILVKVLQKFAASSAVFSVAASTTSTDSFNPSTRLELVDRLSCRFFFALR